MGLGGRSLLPGDPPPKRNPSGGAAPSPLPLRDVRRPLAPAHGAPRPPEAGAEVARVVKEPLRAFLSEMKWERRRSRSRCITQEGIRAHRMEEEAARRGSPTTPLSWSGGTSGTSGSACGGGRRVPLERQKKKRNAHEDGGLKRDVRKRKLEAHQDVGPALTQPSESPETGTVPVGGVSRSDSVVFSGAAVGPSTTSGSEKGVDLAAAAREPLILRFRLPGEGSVSAADGRLGKKKSGLSSHTVSGPASTQIICNEQKRTFLFDLNCIPDEEL